ncbi:MAG: NAD(P)/FAD-dependent oxidoreductase [Lawsonibacter sp.]|nr:NAD(P)/FAD-dependent oxidoreductase [Lawsonibacter sp.]
MTGPLVVVGGGAAGMMAAIAAARQGAKVQLLERNSSPRKLYITGKGRCNVTNHCAPEEVLANTPRNSRFLYSAIQRTPPAWVEQFFEALGVPLKVERGDRVFPQSDKSADIIRALQRELRRLNVPILQQQRVSRLCCQDGAVTGVEGGAGKGDWGIACQAVILATGGVSYPATGSTGDGHRMAEELGHTITPLRPSLVPLESPDPCCGAMQGLALRNVVLTVRGQRNKIVFQEQGELLFTHFGLSGPLVLSASAHMGEFEKISYTCSIDLKPALDEQTLDARLVREFSANGNRDMGNVMGALLPRLMIPTMLERADISPEKKARDVTKGERRRLLESLKRFSVAVSGPRPMEEAIVTSGGVKVSEVDPKTMASKLVKGLYFAGEILDVDAYTGGFNLQIAWATGRAAGESAAEAVLARQTSGS